MKKIINIIKKYKKIICIPHINPDGDALGSAFGLKHFIENEFSSSNKEVIVASENYVSDYLSFLGLVNTNLTKNDFIDSLCIIVDTANISRIGHSKWRSASYVINIDHHQDNEMFGDFNYVNSDLIANCELIASSLIRNDFLLNKKTAQALYTGIITDSNRFLYNRTDSKTLQTASELLKSNFNLQSLYNELYLEDIKYLNLKQKLLTNIKYDDGIAHIIIDQDDQLLKQFTINKIKSYVNIMNGIKQIKIWFICVYDKINKNYSISIRSREYEINKVAVNYNGGGHKYAAGAKINNLNSLDKFINQLKNLIK